MGACHGRLSLDSIALVRLRTAVAYSSFRAACVRTAARSLAGAAVARGSGRAVVVCARPCRLAGAGIGRTNHDILAGVVRDYTVANRKHTRAGGSF